MPNPSSRAKTVRRPSSTRAGFMSREEKTRAGLANNRNHEGNADDRAPDRQSGRSRSGGVLELKGPRTSQPTQAKQKKGRKEGATVSGIARPKRSTRHKGSAAKRGTTTAARSESSKSAAARNAKSSKATSRRNTSKPARTKR